MARSAERARAVFGSDVVPPRNGGGGVPPDGRDGRGAGNNTPTPAVGLGVTWTIGLILIPCAILFLLLLLQLWPPPKPRGSLTIAFQKSTLEVRPGNPAIYTVFIRAPSSFPGSATLEAVILPDDLTYAFAPPGTTSKTGALVPSPAGSSAALTLQTLPGEEKHYSIMVAATGGGQTKTITGRLVVRQDAPEASEAQTRDMSEEHAFREGFSELTVFFWTFPHVPDEVRLFLIVAVVGCLGGLLHSIRSFIWYAGHAGLERHWIPFYATTPIVGMTTAILFYLVFRAGFISPATPASETNAYGFAAIAGLVGLFSRNAVDMLENLAKIVFTEPKPGGGTISPGAFYLSASSTPRTVTPGGTASYDIVVTVTQDFAEPVTLSVAVESVGNNGPAVSLNQTVVTPTTGDTHVTLTATTTATTTPNEYKIIVTGKGGGKTHTVEVVLIVNNGSSTDGTLASEARGPVETAEPHAVGPTERQDQQPTCPIERPLSSLPPS